MTPADLEIGNGQRRSVQTDLLHPNLRPRPHGLGGPGAKWGDAVVDGDHAREDLNVSQRDELEKVGVPSVCGGVLVSCIRSLSVLPSVSAYSPLQLISPMNMSTHLLLLRRVPAMTQTTTRPTSTLAKRRRATPRLRRRRARRASVRRRPTPTVRRRSKSRQIGRAHV